MKVYDPLPDYIPQENKDRIEASRNAGIAMRALKKKALSEGRPITVQEKETIESPVRNAIANSKGRGHNQ